MNVNNVDPARLVADPVSPTACGLLRTMLSRGRIMTPMTDRMHFSWRSQLRNQSGGYKSEIASKRRRYELYTNQPSLSSEQQRDRNRLLEEIDALESKHTQFFEANQAGFSSPVFSPAVYNLRPLEKQTAMMLPHGKGSKSTIVFLALFVAIVVVGVFNVAIAVVLLIGLCVCYVLDKDPVVRNHPLLQRDALSKTETNLPWAVRRAIKNGSLLVMPDVLYDVWCQCHWRCGSDFRTAVRTWHLMTLHYFPVLRECHELAVRLEQPTLDSGNRAAIEKKIARRFDYVIDLCLKDDRDAQREIAAGLPADDHLKKRWSDGDGTLEKG